MASALSNPARGAIHKIRRAVMAGKTTVAKGTKIYMKTKGKKGKKPAWLRPQSQADREAGYAKSLKKRGKKPTQKDKDRRNLAAKIDRQIAKEFKKYAGYGPGFTGRTLGGRANKYLDPAMRTEYTTRDGNKAYHVNMSKLEAKNKNRISRRASGEWGHFVPVEHHPPKGPVDFAERYPKVVKKAKSYDWVSWDQRRKGKGKAGRKPAARKSGSPYSSMRVPELKDALDALGVDYSPKAKKDELIGLYHVATQGEIQRAVSNGLALTNPSYMGMVKAIAIPGVTGAAVALATVIAAEKSGALAWYEEKTAGTFLESVPATAPAAIGAAALAGLAYAVRGQSPMAAQALVGGAVFTFGLGVFADAKSMWDDSMSEEVAAPEGLEGDLEDMAGLAFGGIGFDQLGGLALENPTVLGDLGDGFAYETAPLSAPSYGNYAQSTFGDAYFSGADFSVAEGQALLNGKGSWFGLFGKPTIRTSSVAGRASHLAGQPGHRWGWLIRTVGWTKAQQIVALPPAKRLAVVRQLRAAALATYQKLLASAKAAEVVAEEAPLPAAGVAAAGAQGATTAAAPGNTGAVNYLGDPALFMGA